MRLRTVLENTPVEVTKKPVVKKIGDKLHVFGYPEGKLNPIVNATVDFAEPYGEGVQGIGYQGGNQALVVAVSLIQKENWSVYTKMV